MNYVQLVRSMPRAAFARLENLALHQITNIVPNPFTGEYQIRTHAKLTSPVETHNI